MAREMLNMIPAQILAVKDESYGGYEKDGKVVEHVERYTVWVRPHHDRHQEPIGPLMATTKVDIAIAKAAGDLEAVTVEGVHHR